MSRVSFREESQYYERQKLIHDLLNCEADLQIREDCSPGARREMEQVRQVVVMQRGWDTLPIEVLRERHAEEVVRYNRRMVYVYQRA
jgi:hypothetical protein